MTGWYNTCTINHQNSNSNFCNQEHWCGFSFERKCNIQRFSLSLKFGYDLTSGLLKYFTFYMLRLSTIEGPFNLKTFYTQVWSLYFMFSICARSPCQLMGKQNNKIQLTGGQLQVIAQNNNTLLSYLASRQDACIYFPDICIENTEITNLLGILINFDRPYYSLILTFSGYIQIQT